VSDSDRKEMLAQALRDYPSWGDAYIAEKQRADKLAEVLRTLDVGVGLTASEMRDRAREALAAREKE
jgi:hypothetical protein